MSNFQRTRSKVWWGDSPPNLGSPVAQPAEWNRDNRTREEQQWEPQLPHWIANQPEQQRNNSADNIAQPNAQINQWPLRHGSPGSHKSQDSGFSDSDSSPPPSQYYAPPETNESNNKSSSSSDSNNNENVTIKHVEFVNTPQNVDVVDSSRTSPNNEVPTPKPRLRSSSVIQTPYDLQKYYEIHRDEEHMDLLKDKGPGEENKNEDENSHKKVNNDNLNKENTKPISSKNYKACNVLKNNNATLNKISNKELLSPIKHDTKEVPIKNISALSPSKKYPLKKSLVSNTENDSAKVIKLAKVKDLETNNNNKSDESLEYIKLSDNNEIAVNNQPRVRTPISNISYVPTERSTKPKYNRSISNENNSSPLTTSPRFERNRLNKSLNFEAQKLDQQILDIQDGHHSLGYIDEDTPTDEVQYSKKQIENPIKTLLAKNIMDSLHLKPNKKAGPKAKQRMATKADRTKELFRIFPKKEKTTVVGTHAGGTMDGSRVPPLGLPRSNDHNNWVIVGYPEVEMLIPHYNERLVATDSDLNLKSKDQPEHENNDIKNSRVTPPPQFQDKQKTPYESHTKTDKNLTHDSKREKLKFREEDLNFADVQLDLACMSTPKMLAPDEFMNGRNSGRQNQSRTNLMTDFNRSSRVVLNNQNEILYRERSIDQTQLERLCERKPEPVQHWLCDLIGSYESECMTTLQSKPIGAEMKAMVSASSATITGNIKKVQTHGQIIVHQYSDVLRQIEDSKPSEEQICLLVANINEFVLAHSITLNTKPPGETPERWDKIKKSLQLYLQKLIDIGEDVKIELNESNVEWYLVLKHLDTLIDIFLETTKAVLIQQMKTLVSIIEEPPSDMILKSTLTSIGHLAMLSEPTESSLHEKCSKIMKSITELPFVDCAVPRALLTAIIETNKSSIKALSLRALATVCVTGDAVKQFEEGGGIEIISDILSDRSNPEPQMREAITVLTQITAPWLRGHYDLTQLHLFLDKIVENITGILSRTDCCQLLLLCTACLVNLVRELEVEKRDGDRTKSDIVEVMDKHHTVERLLDAVKRRGPYISVFLQEQTASLVSVLAGVPRCVLALSRAGRVCAALVCFTRSPPSPPARAAELRAQTRLHCHATEAIARLSVIPDVAHQIVQLEGVPHLIRLVRSQRTRPHPEKNPDQTLIHCLKALRNIFKHIPEAFEEYQKDVQEMIRPHLMESLMLFSAKQESYV
ncbi:uncharacterized protein LOC101741429 isoform X1 [Bombyx mori]|uniref:Protein inscuteable homologue C-terminal domain-containing protein n=1 Tax=Bombyx mori TaxID=7091 RepID=A0A8R2QXD3_BOMMO|nr:uncharacterized protein LOC101741429 isoform X1 [Bombyx mori]